MDIKLHKKDKIVTNIFRKNLQPLTPIKNHPTIHTQIKWQHLLHVIQLHIRRIVNAINIIKLIAFKN